MTLISTSQKDRSTFGRSVRAATRGLWNGSLDWMGFVFTLESGIARGYEAAWREGSAVCGIGPEERTTEESGVLNRQIQLASAAIPTFGDYIEQHLKINGHLLRETAHRAEIWAKRYDSIVTLAKATSCSDRKFVWRLGPTADHCDDCARYAGRVHRGSVWQSVGAIPQSTRLACHGFQCLCSLVPTTARATPGRPSRPTG